MARAVDEWIGKTPDTPAPPRVRLRVWDRDHGICQCGCGVKIRLGDKWQTDHIVAIINGGENRERNLRTLLVKHHAEKTREDVAEKSAVADRRKHHLGIKRSSRPMPGSKASGLRKRMDGTVERR